MDAYVADRRTAPPLTGQVIERMRGNGKDRWIKDGHVRRLYLSVRPNGERVFAMRVKRSGAVQMITLDP